MTLNPPGRAIRQNITRFTEKSHPTDPINSSWDLVQEKQFKTKPLEQPVCAILGKSNTLFCVRNKPFKITIMTTLKHISSITKYSYFKK